MTENKQRHTLTLPRTAFTLFTQEICGQISDGAWEDINPSNHWKFWCNLNVVEGDEFDFERNQNCSSYPSIKKASYNLNTLIEYIGDRMRCLAVYARVSSGPITNDICNATEYLYDTQSVELLHSIIKDNDSRFGPESSSSKYWRKCLKDVKNLESKISEEAWNTTKDEYTDDDLKKDLKEVKSYMKATVEQFA